MPGIRSVVYTLHLWPPIAHAKHYTGKPESSRFLKVQFAAVDRELAELSVVSAFPRRGWTGDEHGWVVVRLGRRGAR